MRFLEIRTDYFLRACLVLVALGIFCAAIFSNKGLVDWSRVNSANSNLTEEIEQAQAHRQKLQQQIQSLKKDPLHRELTVRHVLGYVRPDEIVVEFD